MTAAALLGVERHKLLGRFFSHFLVEADRLGYKNIFAINLPLSNVPFLGHVERLDHISPNQRRCQASQ